MQAKFMDCGESLSALTPENKGNYSYECLWVGIGKAMLVPLTSSLYVPGTVDNVDHVIVDIGTGYFAQKVLLGSLVFTCV